MGLRTVAALALLCVGLVAEAGRRNTEESTMQSVMDMCFPAMPLEKLNYRPKRHMVVFTDFEFSCSGEIAAWNFFAAEEGSFFATVWRKHADGRLEMIGKNFVNANQKGIQTYFVPRHLRFKVKAGDVIGIHYADGKGKGVVMFEDDHHGKKVDKSVALSATVGEDKLYEPDLNWGHVLHNAAVHKGKRAPSLFPVFNRNRLQLQGGVTPHEGRAMFLSNGVWGTICDAKFWERGWPDVFCKELGYDHCEEAKFAKSSYAGIGRGAIGYQKPSCPKTGNIFMDECGKDEGTCDHDEDVFVSCAYSTKLEGGKSEAEGRAAFYEDRKWGTICDVDARHKVWPSSVCDEIGFSHAVTVSKAKDSYVGKGSGRVNLKNPTFDMFGPNYLKFSAKPHGSCSHNDDIYVKCTHGVRLAGGKTPDEGIAQVFKRGSWGSACSNKILRDGFPAVFCKELGYDTVIEAKYARSAYTGVASGSVHEINAVCSTADAANVRNCGHPSTTKCGHNEDIFIKCGHLELCKSDPCQNDGVCITLEQSYKCECAPGFSGPNCEIDIDDCESAPCLNGGICHDGKNSFTCTCSEKYTGDTCADAALPKDPVVIHCFDEPSKTIQVETTGSDKHRRAVLSSKSAVPFKLIPGLSGTPGSVSFLSTNHAFSYLRVHNTKIDLELMAGSRNKNSFKTEASFIPEMSTTHPNKYIFRCVEDPNKVIVHTDDFKLKVATLKAENKEFMKTALYYIEDLDSASAIVMHDLATFKGKQITLTEDDSNLGDHGFDDRLNSFEIKGSASWQLFQHRDYDGKSAVAPPGRYDVDWVRTHLGTNFVSSVKKIQVVDGLVLWQNEDHSGDHLTVSHSIEDIATSTKWQSIHVVGPSSWELYSEVNFKGSKAVASPAHYTHDWLAEHLESGVIKSARKVEVNTPMCSATSGQQRMTGLSGKKHSVFVIHKQDGSVWLRFGKSQMHSKWNYDSAQTGVFRDSILSQADIAAMTDFKVIGWEVETDVNLQMSVDDSWHPSRIDVMYLGSKVRETMRFEKTYSDRTDITFSADKARLACTGTIKDGEVAPNVCGQNGLPEYGSTSNALAITKVVMRPNGQGSYAHNQDLSRNAFTWDGTYYYVYAKMAECATSTGCFKREVGFNLMGTNLPNEPGKDYRPHTFFFGTMNDDVEACEAACKNERDCAAYTLLTTKADNAYAGGCYGVGKDLLSDSVKEDNVIGGKAVVCGSFIPQYMEDDMWTRNSTGCPCNFDTSRLDCACCHEGACQCQHRYKYQCSLCGFGDRCGSPFLSTNSHTYTFEYENQRLGTEGRHYTIPDMCVDGCEMQVRGTGSSASKVAAHMTDSTGQRVLSCVASGLDTSTEASVLSTGATQGSDGAPVSGIHLYAFGGVGDMVSLKLKVHKDGCKTETRDPRFAGCFRAEERVRNENDTVHTVEMTSTHMTKALCLTHCYNNNYQFAALQAGTKCKCLMNTPASGAADNCDTFCSGDFMEVCGGKNSLSIYRTELRAPVMIFNALSGECEKVGGQYMATIPIRMTGDECNRLTQSGTSGDELVDCSMDWCVSQDVLAGSMFVAKRNSCGDRLRGHGFVRTTGADCLNMGSTPTFAQTAWGLCPVDICVSDVPRRSIYVPAPHLGCKAANRVAQFVVEMTGSSCRLIGGAKQDLSAPDANVTGCILDMCIADQNPVDNNVYSFQHNNEVISEGAVHRFTLPEMCVSECEFSFEASQGGLSIGEVTLLDENNMEAGLFCGARAENGSKADVLSFADKATGVKVSGLQMTATNHSFVLNDLKFLHNPDGCKDDEVILVLYEEPNFGGRPKVIREDLADLDTVDFNNKARSFKIFGNMMWELFENKNYKGRSVVLDDGEYYDTSELPFGADDLSSVHRAGTIDTNMDQTRKDISNARGLVCFKRAAKANTVFGLPPNGPRSENRPRVFYFGEMGDSVDACERACRAEPQCASFTLFSTKSSDAMRAWRGLCYGRSFRDDISTHQADVISGTVAACAEEDTLTLYTNREFAGSSVTIIEDIVNVTFSAGPFSALVTGKDTWRVLTVSEGHFHTYKLAPGEYSDLSYTLVGQIFQVSKMHPNTQLYNEQHDQIDLNPVAFNQIKKTITTIRTKVGEKKTTTGEVVCNTTQLAEIFFVVDASSSVRDYNYVKVLDFMAKLVESFSIGADDVRVGVLIYSFYTHIDIPLGHHTDSQQLQDAIRALEYYKGGTYTHKALQDLREQGLVNTRDGVSKQAIVITDGRSRHVTRTADQAHLCRDDGIVMTAVGIKGADYQELHNIAGDASRVYNVSDFSELDKIVKSIESTTCKAVEQGNVVWNETEHVSITVQGDDSNYFVHVDNEFNRKPVPLGMESGVIYDKQIFASSSLVSYEAELARLNHKSGWMTTIGNHTRGHEWIEVDLGKILPIHGVSTQGHGNITAWVTKYKIAISLDGIHFVTFKDTNTSMDLIFIANEDQHTVKYHCLHRLFGQAIRARVIRFIVVEWHVSISMRIELYGFRDADDPQLVEALRKDVWTRNVTGCPCYFDPSRRDTCACCEDGGCQCPNSDRHQCVQCGYPHNCGIPSLRNPVDNIDGWTSSMSGCRCQFDRLRTDCACCQNYGCQCGGGNKNQCVNCGHPEHCGLKEHLFGPNPYCRPKTCPRTINTIWEGPPPTGINPGDKNPVIKEDGADVKQAAETVKQD